MIVWTKIRPAFCRWIKAVSIGRSHATISDICANRSIHFTLIVQQHVVNPDQNLPMYSITGILLNKKFDVL